MASSLATLARAPGRAAGRWGGRLDLALALLTFGATLALLGLRGDASRGLDAPAVALAALATLPLVARRRSPLGVLALTPAASAALNGLGYAPGPPFGPTVALFFVAADERTRARVWATAAVVLGLFAVHVGATAIAEGGFPLTSLLFGILVWGTAWVAGDQVRQRRGRAAEARERAARAERDRERDRRLAAAEERARIARDLHDSAGHAINVILVQASAARLLQERDPDRARMALETVEEVARETVTEIDRLVRVLRDDDEAAAAVEPPSGLAELSSLTERHRAAGLDVSVRVRGDRRSLPRAVDRTAYRILQEALTNAAVHGRGAASVEMDFAPNGLELAVSNPTASSDETVAPAREPSSEEESGPPAPRSRGGHGIVGMRERAALVGGSVRVEAAAASTSSAPASPMRGCREGAGPPPPHRRRRRPDVRRAPGGALD
jgi:signal transduction histidine kinase